MNILTAFIDHRYGTTAFAAVDENTLYRQLHIYVSEWWQHELQEKCPSKGSTHENRKKLVDRYFERVEQEYLYINEVPLRGFGKWLGENKGGSRG